MFKRIYGWGNNTYSLSKIVTSKFEEFVIEIKNERGFIPRGLGRSYGDSAINSGGVCFDSRELTFIEIDPSKGIALVGAGASILELEKKCLTYGLFPFVVPGTANVTIGGAIASDIHGKSHHKIGSFSNYLSQMKLLTADGTTKSLRPDDETSELFWATVGGMGLTGMITEATISLMNVGTSLVNVEERRVKNLKQLLETMINFNEKYLYTVAWIDLSGKYRGRGIVSGANHCGSGELLLRKFPKRIKAYKQTEVKIFIPFGLSIINQASIRIFNALWYRKPLNNGLRNVQKFMHPLDTISNWNKVYGTPGFVQYQFVIPFNQEEVIEKVLSKLKSSGCGSILSVLKSFGPQSKGLLSFPMEGWTLAIDLPAKNQNIPKLLRELDGLILNSGGRVYLTKDSRMDLNHLPIMYSRLNQWRLVKGKVDPENLWQSDQGRRLKLC